MAHAGLLLNASSAVTQNNLALYVDSALCRVAYYDNRRHDESKRDLHRDLWGSALGKSLKP